MSAWTLVAPETHTSRPATTYRLHQAIVKIADAGFEDFRLAMPSGRYLRLTPSDVLGLIAPKGSRTRKSDAILVLTPDFVRIDFPPAA